MVGKDDDDLGVDIEGTALFDGPHENFSIVRGRFKFEEKPDTYVASGSVCSEETDQDGYWVVAPGEAPEPTFNFTINPIEHTTYTYTVDGDSEAPLTGLTNGTKVVVTYAAAPGYKITEATASAAVKEYTINGDDGETDQVVEVEASPYAGTDYAPWAYSSGVILWRGTQNDFHASTVADVAADGTVGDAYTMNTAQWHRFASNQSQYVSPGLVLVYDTPGTDQGYKYNPDCSFTPLSFGGMWVKTLAINGLPFSILGTGTRSTEFGAPNKSTFFKFDASYTIDRTGTTTFYGDATVEIADGATFTAQANSSQVVAVDSSATLKLQGAGTLAVTTMNVAGTLDLSATTVPSISGNVALAGNSTLVLPAGTALDDTISLEVCSGTLSAAGVVYVKVGDGEPQEAALTISDGSITQITTGIQTEQTFTSEPYPDVVPAGYTYTYAATDAVTIPAVTVNGTLKTSGPITITDLDVANGADFEVVAGNTTVGCSAVCKLKGNIKVDAGATLTNTRTDSLSYNHAMTVDIYGTLAMGETRWSVPGNCTFKLHAGAQVTGPGDSLASLDFINGASKGLDVYAGEASSARIEGKVRVRANESRIWIGDNTTLVLESGIADGGGHHAGFKQVGPGTLEIHANSTGLSGDTSVMTQGTLRIVDTTLAFPVELQGANSYLEVVATEAATTVPINVTSIANNNVTFSGAGKVNGSITKTSAPGGNLATALQSSAWTGTFVADWEGATATRFDINSYGNANSVVEVTKLAGGYVGDASTAIFNVLPTVKVSGTMKLDNGFTGKVTSFARLTGSGTFTQGGVYPIDIAVLDGFTGTIVGEAAGGTSIGTINLATAPTVGDKLVTISPSGQILYGFESTKVSVNGVVDETIRLETKSGGIYVKASPVAQVSVYNADTGDYDVTEYDTIAAAVTAVNGTSYRITLLANVAYEMATTDEFWVIPGEFTANVTAPSGYHVVADERTVLGALHIQYTCEEDFVAAARIGSVEGQNEFATVDAALVHVMSYNMAIGTVVYVLDADYKRSSTSAELQQYFDWDSTARTWTRRATTAGEGSQTVTAVSAEAACAQVTVLPTSSEVEAALAGYPYATYFQKTAVDNGNGTWTVTVTLSKPQVFEGDAAEATTLTEALDGVLDGTADEITIPAKRGLYYSFASGTEVDNLVEGDRVLATSGSVTLDKTEGATFYQVLVHTTPKE